MAATVMADPELTKAFAEHQAKMIETTQRVKMARGQIDALKMASTRAGLTAKELSGVPDGTRTYESVGRMFILRPLEEIRTRLKSETDDAAGKIETIQGNVVHLEAELKSSEDNVRELVSQKRKEL